MAAKLKKGDKVVVTVGKDKGKSGEITQVMPTQGRAIVQGVNLVKKHKRPTQEDPNGGIESREAPIQLSNLMYVDKDDAPTRVGFKTVDGKKVRFAKKSGEVING